MAVKKIIRLPDPERRSRKPDAVMRPDDEPCIIIVLPIIRIERFSDPKPNWRRKRRRRGA